MCIAIYRKQSKDTLLPRASQGKDSRETERTELSNPEGQDFEAGHCYMC